MDLGAFSVSLPVADLDVSREFYGTLGFAVVGGSTDDGYLVLGNGSTLIGVFCFEGMDFRAPMLTFNPGWTQDRGTSSDFTDVRDIAAALEAHGARLLSEPEAGSAPAHLVVLDPDGHRILVDQFVGRPTPPT